MDTVVCRGKHAHELQFRSPVYTASIMGEEEHVLVGIGGGKQYGMPNAMVLINPNKQNSLCWDVEDWIDLDDDQPWTASDVFVEEGTKKGPQENFVVVSHLDAASLICVSTTIKGDDKKATKSPKSAGSSAKEAVESRAGINRVARKALVTKAGDANKKCLCVCHSYGESIEDAIIFCSQDDGSICVMKPVRNKGSKLKDVKASNDEESKVKGRQKDYPYHFVSLTITAEELGLNPEGGIVMNDIACQVIAAKGTTSDTDERKARRGGGVVVMLVCSDKKVRYLLLPPRDNLIQLLREKGVMDEEEVRDAPVRLMKGEKPIEGAPKTVRTAFGIPATSPYTLVKSMIVVSKLELGLDFDLKGSSMRIGRLIEGGHECLDVLASVLLVYDSNRKSTLMVLSVLVMNNDGILTLKSFAPQVEKDYFETSSVRGKVKPVPSALSEKAHVFYACPGPVTSIQPLDGPKHTPASHRTMPPEWLVSTVEGELFLLDSRSNTQTLSSSWVSMKSVILRELRYAISEQRPYVNKRLARMYASSFGPLHLEPISALANSSSSGLVVSVDIGQNARLSIVRGKSHINSNPGAKRTKLKTFYNVPELFHDPLILVIQLMMIFFSIIIMLMGIILFY
eukprot:Tbor_TRINITY_DN4704_c0_g1::TRINITY_DN4704_c0_g1_i1::g.16986::m.16986